ERQRWDGRRARRRADPPREHRRNDLRARGRGPLSLARTRELARGRGLGLRPESTHAPNARWPRGAANFAPALAPADRSGKCFAARGQQSPDRQAAPVLQAARRLAESTRLAVARGSRGSRPGAPRRERPRSRSEEHTSELQSRENLVCRLLLEKKKEFIIFTCNT